MNKKKAFGLNKKRKPKIIFILANIPLLVFIYIFHSYYVNKENYSVSTSADSDYTNSFINNSPDLALVSQTNIQINRKAGNYSSIFLKVHIKRNRYSFLREPTLSLSYKNRTSKQSFSPYVNGYRYFDVSSLISDEHGDLNIKLNCSGCTVKAGKAQIYYGDIVSEHGMLAGKTLLIISPHPDDGEIGAFSLYQHSSWVVTITNGEGGKPYYRGLFKDKKSSYIAKAKLRVIDSRAVPLIGDIPMSNTVNLGYFDTTLDDMWFRKTVSAIGPNSQATSTDVFRSFSNSNLTFEYGRTVSWSELVKDLAMLINYIQPDIVVAPHPILDNHTDHYLSALAAFQAMKIVSSKADAWFYVVHGQDKMYPYGSNDNLIGLPHSDTDLDLFDYVFSVPVDTSIRINKLLALEAMHDIRIGGTVQCCAKRNTFMSHIFPNKSFYRKAVRPNELFFVIKNENLNSSFDSYIDFINDKGPYKVE